jgi:hypothetical protein
MELDTIKVLLVVCKPMGIMPSLFGSSVDFSVLRFASVYSIEWSMMAQWTGLEVGHVVPAAD